MKFVLTILATVMCTNAFAGPMCNVKTLGLANELAQLDGIIPNTTEGAYSRTNLYSATVNQSVQYAFFADDSGKSCSVENILVGELANDETKKLSMVECNIKATKIAQKVGQFNGLSGNKIDSTFSTTNSFVVTVDDSEIFEITVSSDDSCLLQKVALKK